MRGFVRGEGQGRFLKGGRFLASCFVVALAFATAAESQGSPIPISELEARGSGNGHPWQGGHGGVNLYSLNKQSAVHLVGWRARGGLPIGMSLFHNSLLRFNNPTLGKKWLHSGDTHLQVWNVHNFQKAAVVRGDGTIQMFIKDPVWRSADGYRDTLSEVGSSYDLTLKDQTVLHFESVLSKVIRRHRLDSISDSNGNQIDYQYDSLSRLIRVDDTTGRFLLMNYGTARLQSMVFVAPGGFSRIWNYSYDGLGRLIRIDLPTVTTDSGPQAYDIEFSYDANGNILTMTDQENNIWSYGYSGDRIAFAQWPVNTVAERVLYASAGNQRTVTDPRGNQTMYEYDSLSRLIRVRNASFFDVFLDFLDVDYPHGVSRILMPSGTQYQYDHDTRANLVGYTDPANERWDYAYDSRNNLVRAEEPLVTDVYGNIEPSRHRTDYFYDARSNLIQRDRYTGPATFVSTVFQYNAVGNLTALINPLNRVWVYQYDIYGNRVRAATPMARDIEWFYDNAALSAGFTQPNAWADANGLRTDLLRDEWGRLRRRDFPAEPDHQYSYDGLSRLVRMVDATGQTDFAYDGRGWLISATKGPWIWGCIYYANGLRSSMFENSGTGPHTISYNYDPRNLLDALNDNGVLSTFTYDADGRLVNRQLGNGAKTNYLYSLGRLSSVTQLDIFNAPIHTSSYFYQDNGSLKLRNEPGSLTRYDYDMLDRLVREERTAAPIYNNLYSYDSVGNRIQQSLNGVNANYQYDFDNLLVQAVPQGMGPELYQYDNNGRLIQRNRNNNTELFQFDYTTAGNLANMQRWNGAIYEPYANYIYDGLSRRVMRNTFQPGGLPNTQGKYYYHPDDLGGVVRVDNVVQGNPSNSVMTWAGGLIGCRNVTTGVQELSATDGLGNMRAYTFGNGNDGSYREVYNAFGESMFVNGNPSEYRYMADLGARTEGDAGLLCFQEGGPNPAPRTFATSGIVGSDHAWGSFYDPKIGLSLPSGPNAGAVGDTDVRGWRPRFCPPAPYVRGTQQVVQPTGIGGGVAVSGNQVGPPEAGPFFDIFPRPITATSSGPFQADTVGFYVNSGTWFMTNTNVNGPADYFFGYGPHACPMCPHVPVLAFGGGGATPIVGDWNSL